MSDYQVRETQLDGHAAVTLVSDAGAIDATFVPGANMLGASLRHRGVELLDPRGGVARYVEHGSTMGIPLLYPWANRLAGSQYAAGGRSVDLEPHRASLHYDPNGLPMHGLQPSLLAWHIERAEATAAAATLVGRLPFTSEALLGVFPYPHELTLTAVLRDRTLAVTTSVHPIAGVAVPVSFGFHPYFRVPDLPRPEWVLGLPVRRRLVLDGRMIPTGATEPIEIPAGPLAGRGFDDAYTALTTPARFTLVGGLTRLAVELEAHYPYAQIYAPPGDAFVCIEPMTAPTNALVTGTGLRFAQPGEAFGATFTVTVE